MMKEQWHETPTGFYPELIRKIDKSDKNTLFARSVLTQDADGFVFQNTQSTAWYIVHHYGMTLLLGDCEDEAFQAALLSHFANLQKDEWLQAEPDAWNSFLRTLCGQGLANEFGRVNFTFDEVKFHANDKKSPYPVLRTPVSLIASLEGKVVPRDFWKPALYENCIAYTVYVNGEPASTAFAAYLHGSVLELGIETQAAFRGKGMAELSCRALIDHCLANHYTPDWSCLDQNTGSIALAKKLGFVPLQKDLPYYQILARRIR